MAKLSQLYRMVLPLVILVLVLTASAPITSVQSEGSGKCSSTSTLVFYTNSSQQNNTEQNTGALENPINLLKNIFGSECNDEEEREIAPQAGILVRAIQALAATLLSTII